MSNSRLPDNHIWICDDPVAPRRNLPDWLVATSVLVGWHLLVLAWSAWVWMQQSDGSFWVTLVAWIVLADVAALAVLAHRVKAGRSADDIFRCR